MKGFDVTNKKYRGLNAFSEVTSLSPDDLRQATNVDIYSGDKNDSIQCRRGSAALGGSSYGAGIKNRTVFAVGDDEYLVTQVGDALYSQKVSPTVGNPARIHTSLLTMAVTGDHLSSPIVNGMTPGNTDNWGLYIDVLEEGGTHYTVRVFKDAAKTQQVGNGTLPIATLLPATLSWTQSGSSGLSGSFRLLSAPGSTPKAGTVGYAAWDAGTATNDIKNANQKIFCFSQEGNSVISWNADEGRFEARPMGLEAPVIGSTTNYGTGDLPAGGRWYYGVEKVIQQNGGDVVASSPNRKRKNGELASLATTDPSTSGGLLLDPPSFLTDPYWTHIRVWRSKNTTPDLSDPLFPLDAQGVPGQLYEVALITREEMLGAFGPINALGDVPPGNSGVSAGLDSGFYIIEDGNDDSVLVNFVDLDRIDLVPIPPARTGAVHAGRVFVSGINQADIDPDLAEDVLYTTEVYSAYQEQWDPQAFLNAGRNSFKTTMLQSFNDDLLIIREGETKRIPSGNVDAGIQMVDDKIGVQSFLMAGFVTGLGIAAVCSDRYFRYLGFDYRWHSTINKIDASNAIYPFTKVQAATAASFGYINGKLIMLLIDLDDQTDYGFFALHVKEGRGWTRYTYLRDDLVCMFNFSDGLRAGVIPAESGILEIEVDTDTDWDGAGLVKVAGTTEFAPVRPESGMLDVSQFSFWGKLSENATIEAKSSGVSWQMLPTFQQPGLWAAESSLNEREYIFKPQPQTVGVFKWVPLRGQFVSFVLSTTGRFFLSWNRTLGSVRETMGDLGVFQSGGIIPQCPGWASSSQILLNFEDPGETFYDASGKGNNLDWLGVGTKTNRVAQKPGRGLEVVASGAYPTSPMADGPGGSFTTHYRDLTFTGMGDSSYLIGETVYITQAYQGDGFFELFVYSGEPRLLMYGVVNAASPGVFALAPAYPGAPSATIELFDAEGLPLSLMEGTAVVAFASPAVMSGPTNPVPTGKNLTFKAVLSLTAGKPFLAQGGDIWSLYVGSDKLEFNYDGVIYTAGGIPSGEVYVVVFVYGTESTGQFYASPLTGYVGRIATTKGVGPAVSATGIEIFIGGIVSYFEIEATKYTDQQAKRFWGIVKAY